VPGVVRLKQSDLTFGLLFWKLAEDVFREMVLKFTERGHAIINAIEEQKNADTGERTAGKADEETLEQSGSHRDRRGRHFHNGNLVADIDDL